MSSRPRPLSEIFVSNGDVLAGADVLSSTSKQPIGLDPLLSDSPLRSCVMFGYCFCLGMLVSFSGQMSKFEGW